MFIQDVLLGCSRAYLLRHFSEQKMRRRPRPFLAGMALPQFGQKPTTLVFPANASSIMVHLRRSLCKPSAVLGVHTFHRSWYPHWVFFYRILVSQNQPKLSTGCLNQGYRTSQIKLSCEIRLQNQDSAFLGIKKRSILVNHFYPFISLPNTIGNSVPQGF